MRPLPTVLSKWILRLSLLCLVITAVTIPSPADAETKALLLLDPVRSGETRQLRSFQ